MSNKEVVHSRVLSVHQRKAVTGGGGGGANATGEASGDTSGDTSGDSSGEEGDAPLRPVSEYKVVVCSDCSHSVPTSNDMITRVVSCSLTCSA